MNAQAKHIRSLKAYRTSKAGTACFDKCHLAKHGSAQGCYI